MPKLLENKYTNLLVRRNVDTFAIRNCNSFSSVIGNMIDGGLFTLDEEKVLEHGIDAELPPYSKFRANEKLAKNINGKNALDALHITEFRKEPELFHFLINQNLQKEPFTVKMYGADRVGVVIRHVIGMIHWDSMLVIWYTYRVEKSLYEGNPSLLAECHKLSREAFKNKYHKLIQEVNRTTKTDFHRKKRQANIGRLLGYSEESIEEFVNSPIGKNCKCMFCCNKREIEYGNDT